MMNEKRTRIRGSLFFPLLLIAIGLLFLLSNFGVLRGDAWELILKMWPVLLIVWGLDSVYRREGIVGPVLLIGVGSVFLLSNLGFLALNVWGAIIKLWPILLVAIGVDIAVGHRRSPVWSLVGLLIVLAMLVGALWAFGIVGGAGQVLTGQKVEQPLQGANRASVTLAPGVGSLRMEAHSLTDILLSGTVNVAQEGRISRDFVRSGETAALTLRSQGDFTVGFGSAGVGDWDWKLGLTPAVPLTLDLSMGVGKIDLNLTGLTVEAIKVDMGVGETIVTLPANGGFTGKINGAIGMTTLVVPKGTAISLKVDTGLAGLNVPPDFKKQGDVYTSPGYSSPAGAIVLEASQAIGNLQIRYASGN